MTLDREDDVKDGKEVQEILEAFDLTGSFRAAGELAGCSPNTVADWVAKRDRGELGDLAGSVRRERKLDEFLAKIEEWVDRSNGKIRADVCHEKLMALGYEGSDRTVRRAVAEVKTAFRAGRRRVYRPWITEPGMWAQWDWGQGPRIGGDCRAHVDQDRSIETPPSTTSLNVTSQGSADSSSRRRSLRARAAPTAWNAGRWAAHTRRRMSEE